MTRRKATDFALLCLLTGSAWIVDAALPAALPGALGLLINSAILALVFYLAHRKLPKFAAQILACAALIFSVPGALASLSDGHLSSTTIVLIYTLVPAATIFFAAQSTQSELLPNLGPALAGIAGAALILPFALPASTAGTLWLLAMILSALAAAYAALRLHRLLIDAATCPTAALAAAANALIAAPLYAFQRPTLVLLTWPQALLSETVHLSITAATLILSVRLLRGTDPIAFSTRYLLIPLVTIAEGYFFLHPHAPWTLPVGAALLAGGSWLLLRNPHQT